MSHPPLARRQFLAGSAALGAGALGLSGCAQTTASGLQAPAGPNPIATVAQGALRGVNDGQVVAFKRVPYAANPFTAANRFKAPRAAPAWQGMLAAIDCDATFRMPTLRYAEQRVGAGAPVWLYNFAWPR